MKKFKITTVLAAISLMVAINVNAQFTSKTIQVIEFVVPSGPFAGEIYIIKPGQDIGDLLAGSGKVAAYMTKQELVSAIPSTSGLTKAKLIVNTSGMLSSLMKGSFGVQAQYTLVLDDGTSYVVFSLEIRELHNKAKSIKIYTYRNGKKIFLKKKEDQYVVRAIPERLEDLEFQEISSRYHQHHQG